MYYAMRESTWNLSPKAEAVAERSAKAPLVVLSSYPPRKCGIATFTEEALEFVRAHMPDRPIHIIAHTDARGPNVHPILDPTDPDWHQVVAQRIRELRPYAVHIEHEYGLYHYIDEQGRADENERFLRLLDLIPDIPTVVEPHTVHGRYKEREDAFLRGLVERCTLLLLKCDYQRWRMGWNFKFEPENVRVVPHGARPDKLHLDPEQCKRALGLDELRGKRVMGLIGWIQANKRWDLVLDQWEDLARAARAQTGEEWVLLCAGNMRDPNDTAFFHECREKAQALQARGLARYVEFDPRGELYYTMMGCYDAVALPSLDETQSGTLARIFALAKPYITTAPLEGLTSQTVESEAGLLFSNPATLRRGLLRLMTRPDLRAELAANAREYVRDVVSWDVVAEQYLDAYAMATAKVAVARRGPRADELPDRDEDYDGDYESAAAVAE
ncbi:MAG TPA: glycosyltransferase family 4 protein [Ktedonobacterales bacterium]